LWKGSVESSMSGNTPKRKHVTWSKEAIFIVDLRELDPCATRTYIFEFDETDVHLRVWNALMAMKAEGRFYFPNVGDSGYQDLVHDVADRRGTDGDFQDFFDVAMDEEHRFPKPGDTCQTPSKCSWMVYLVEE